MISKLSTRTKAFVGVAVVAGLTLPLVPGADAEYAPSGTDVVGVGGVTPQYPVDFAFDGDFNGNAGYNGANSVNKAVSIDSVADANGREAYNHGSTVSVPVFLNPTVVYRAGTQPVQRIKSTGAGYSALLADTGAIKKINFVRAANLPSSAQQSTAVTNGWGGLHVVQIGTDPVDIVASNTTHAPAGLSVNDLLNIYTGVYTKWNQIPGNSGGSTNNIVPLIPPTGSSISKLLLDDLKVANGGTAITLSSSVQIAEQNDPSTVAGHTQKDDAIAPFSRARLNLWNDGYFKNPNTVFPGGAVLSPGIKSLLATPPGGGTSWSNVNGIYIAFRESDASSPTPFQPGGTKNWVQTLFSDPTPLGVPWFERSAGQALVAAGGDIPGYVDLGIVSAG